MLQYLPKAGCNSADEAGLWSEVLWRDMRADPPRGWGGVMHQSGGVLGRL